MVIYFTDKNSLRRLNKALMGFILFVIIFFAMSFFKSGSSFKTSDYSLVQDNVQMQTSVTLKDLVTYKKVVSSRELFRPFVLSKKTKEPVKTIDDFTKDLILVGVVSVDNKEAIIKDRRTRQTYFVSVGSRIGEIKVENISDDKIEVSYKQERKMLFLR